VKELLLIAKEIVVIVEEFGWVMHLIIPPLEDDLYADDVIKISGV
jgi:hypothetical protein